MAEATRVAKFRLTAELLVAALHLPPFTRIVRVNAADCRSPLEALGDCGRDVVIVVSHPDLKESDPAREPPFCEPRFRRQEPVVFEGWGQEV